MKKHGHWLEQISDSIHLPEEPLPGVPVLELADDRRILIENHQGIKEYGPGRIRIQVRFGMLCICGTCMELRQMSKNQLVISGGINQIALERRKCR